MKLKIISIIKTYYIAMLIAAIPVGVNAETTDNDLREVESRKVIKEFGGKLVKELKQAIKEGGPENAIKVCNIEAPKMATALSEKYNWQIGRTALKTRNPNNAPDAWEQVVLEQFEQRKQNGEKIKTLEYAETTDAGYRYMKAIPTKGLCLACHGENISEALKATLVELYPQDKATGFKAGDIRGAFTVVQSK